MEKLLTKILCTLLLAMMGMSVNAQPSSGSCGDNATWEYDNGTLTISGTGAMADYTDALTDNPWNDYRTSITKVVIGDDITHIGNWAFMGCGALSEVTIGDHVASIGAEAFANCLNEDFKYLAIPASVENIGAFALSNIKYLEYIACYASTAPTLGLEALTILNNLVAIYVPTAKVANYQAATGWRDLSAKITYPHGNCGDGEPATDAVTWAFDMASGTMTLTGTGAVKTFSDQNPMAYPWNSEDAIVWNPTGMDGNAWGWQGITSLVIGEGITNLPDYSFGMYIHLTSVTLPSTLTSVGASSLEECAFTSITLPEGLETIGDYAFLASEFSSITLPSTLTTIGGSAFNDCESLTSITIPANVTSIGESAFQNCIALETVTMLRATPPTLGDLAFYDYNDVIIPALTAINVPAANVEDYKAAAGWSDYAALIVAGGGAPATTTTFTYTATEKIAAFDTYANFTGATALKSHDWDEGTGAGTVVYEGTVTALALRALKGAKLTTITIPASVTTIGDRAFENCTTLTAVAFAETPTVETFGEYAFAGCDALAAFTVPSGVTTLGVGLFQSCDELATITIPESVTSLGENCFMYCKKLNTVNFTGTPQVGAISKNLFHYCDALAAIAIPASVTTIGDNAFNQCKALSSVTFTGSSSLTTIGTCAFSGCTSLETITLPESLTTIGTVQEMGGDLYYNGSVFSKAGITSIELPKNLTTIYGGGHFTNCPITSLTVNAANTKYDSRDGCNAVIETASNKFVLGCVASTVPDGIVSIGREAYFGEEQEFSLTLPESVTTIEERAFHYSTGLKSINIPSGVTEILAETFAQCNFTNLVIPNSVTTIGEMAFAMCMSLKTLTLGGGLTEIGDWAFGMCPNVTDVYCYADPSKLTWDGAGFADDKATNFHVADVSAWPHETDGDKFYGANVTFVGGLGTVAGNAVEGAYWATYYNSAANMKADANTTVYKAAVNGSSLTLTEIDDKVITAGQAVILKSTGASIAMTTSDAASADDYSGNALEGVDMATAVDANYKYYVLSNEYSTLGFYHFTGATLGANKAFIKVPVGPARGFFGFDDTTGISATLYDKGEVITEKCVYNLSGQRVNQPTKGLYIVNGKKVVLK